MHLELEIRKQCKLDKCLPCHWKTGQIFMSLLVAIHKCFLISTRSCAHLPVRQDHNVLSAKLFLSEGTVKQFGSHQIP